MEASQARHRLQTEPTADSDGMSMDTIAIMLTVFVGTAGYVMQAYIAQRAERSSEAAAQELHVHEQEREREHMQVVAQIKRTDRWLDGQPSTQVAFAS